MEAIKKILRTPSAFVLFLIAIVSLIGVIIKSETDKEIARIPIDATSTAEARLTQFASTAIPNQIAVITETIAPTITVITPTETQWSSVPILKDSENFPAFPQFPISYRHLSVGYGEIYIGTAVRFAARAYNYSTIELNENIPYTVFVIKGPHSLTIGGPTEVDLEIDNGGWEHWVNVYDENFISGLIIDKVEEVRQHANYGIVGHNLVIIPPP